jgi:hypothetical protein
MARGVESPRQASIQAGIGAQAQNTLDNDAEQKLFAGNRAT